MTPMIRLVVASVLALAATVAPAHGRDVLPVQLCAAANLNTIFNDGFAARPFQVGAESRELTWSVSSSQVGGAAVTQSVPTDVVTAFDNAFAQWAGQTSRFTVRRVPESTADMLIGMVAVVPADTATIGAAISVTGTAGAWFITGTALQIDPASLASYPDQVAAFAVQQAARLLGLGLVPASTGYMSSLEVGYPDRLATPSQSDSGLIKQLYGQPICEGPTSIAAWSSAQTELKSLQTQLNGLNKKLAATNPAATAAAKRLTDLERQLASAQRIVTTTTAKLNRICAAKPKPKGC